VTPSVPAGRVDSEKTAVPFESDACPKSVAPFMKLTSPVGTAEVPLVLATVAVNLTSVPYTTGTVAESASEIETLAAFTCCETIVDVTAVKLALLL
jgi:hypothetical protein